jgi:hypothetical protein
MLWVGNDFVREVYESVKRRSIDRGIGWANIN